MKNSFFYILILFTVSFYLPIKTNAQDLKFALESYENMQYDLALKDFAKVWKKKQNRLRNKLNVRQMYPKSQCR